MHILGEHSFELHGAVMEHPFDLGLGLLVRVEQNELVN